VPHRRDFIRMVVAGAITTRSAGAASAAGQAPPARRRVAIGGRPVRVIDVHAHCVIPVEEIVAGTPLAGRGGGAASNLLGPGRLAVMDQQGVDVQALTINGFWWYAADRELAGRIVRAQNDGLAAWVKAHPDRFVAMASVALQHPDQAAAQLEDGVTRLGFRGASIADVPFNWPVTVDLVLDAPFLSDDDKAAILGGNAARLLRL
jgi:predicted TIM-barrel fold metal-dependent hydrolase